MKIAKVYFIERGSDSWKTKELIRLSSVVQIAEIERALRFHSVIQ